MPEKLIAEPQFQLLLADDDADGRAATAIYLSQRGFAVEECGDGAQILERALREPFDMLVLDVMLPTLDGHEILRQLRASSGAPARLPVVMISGHADEIDRIVALELGADDFLGKPFHPRELVARLRAVLRRAAFEKIALETAVTPDDAKMAFGNVQIDGRARGVWIGGEPLELTPTEFDLLRVLAQNAGTVLSKDELSMLALGRKLLALDRSLDMHLSNLRKKLAGAAEIKTVRGVGVILEPLNQTST